MVKNFFIITLLIAVFSTCTHINIPITPLLFLASEEEMMDETYDTETALFSYQPGTTMLDYTQESHRDCSYSPFLPTTTKTMYNEGYAQHLNKESKNYAWLVYPQKNSLLKYDKTNLRRI